MFAIIKTGGKQYKVQKDDKIRVELIEGKEGDSVDVPALFTINGDKTNSDAAKVNVKAKIVEQASKDDKVIIFKKKRRQNYRRTRGHRQQKTVLQITDIKG